MTRLVSTFFLFTFYFLSLIAVAHEAVTAGSPEENQERVIVFPDTKQFSGIQKYEFLAQNIAYGGNNQNPYT